MKTSIITEFVKIEVLQTTTLEQLMEKADIVNAFLQKQDGFIDAELVKAVDDNVWYFIYHIESMEKLKAVGEKLRSSKMFDHITPLIVPESLSVNFFEQTKKW
ncbi:MAG TPA: hypothetical protein PK252_11550 [Bacteroidales bacterium]|nr:hypothetical protein [Bacteroidales bacterium]